MMEFLLVATCTFLGVFHLLCALLAVCYFTDTYHYASRLVFYIAILCPLWNCYFAFKFLVPCLKTFKPNEWLKRNFSFKE